MAKSTEQDQKSIKKYSELNLLPSHLIFYTLQQSLTYYIHIQNLLLGALNSRSALYLLAGVLFKQFTLEQQAYLSVVTHEIGIDQLLWSAECKNYLNNSGNDSFVSESVQTLRFVFGVYRHGFRAPIYNPYPSDPYQDLNKYFPEGKGGLTKKGKWQLYRTGQALRQNYDNFLGELYSTDKYYFVSTEIERTILSAQLLAAGIFPPVSFQKWSESIDWQPIPIWRDNHRIDKTIVFLNRTVCPRFQKDTQYVLSQRDMNSDLLQLYSLLSQYAGMQVNTTDQIFQLWDILTCEENNGLTLPEWTKNIFPEKMKPTVADLFSVIVSGTGKMLQITAGALLTEIRDQFSAKANQTLQPDRKLYLLGAHDVTIIALLHSIGIKKSIIIKPADMVLLELHENKTFHSVKVFFTETVNMTTVMHELMIPGCESPCDLQMFMNITKQYTSVHWDLLCQS